MSNVVRFPARETREQKLESVFQVYRRARASKIEVRASSTGTLQEPLGTRAVHRLACSAESFSVMESLRDFYRTGLSTAEIEGVIAEIRATRAYSEHIVAKAAEYIRTRELLFRREAQFPPTIIRRPEKNIYFATTFNMVMTRFFVGCQHLLLEKNAVQPMLVVENMQDCDRCSLRLLQNMHLYLKPFGFEMTFVFKVGAPGAAATNLADDPYGRRFVAARRSCFRKFLNVIVAAGNSTEIIDTDGLVDMIDFASGYAHLRATLADAKTPDLDDFMDYVYRNAYEEFYVRKSLHDADPSLEGAEALELEKLLLLCDSYNYQFEEALAVADAAVGSEDDLSKCWFLLMRGLVLLKKKNDKAAALTTLEEGLRVARALPPSLEAETEKAFLGNAVNFVRLLGVMATLDGDERATAIDDILSDEHRILRDVCEAFINATEADLARPRSQLNVLFIITTIVENISKLNGLLGAWNDTIELYRSYEHILDTVGSRMRDEDYKRSFTISYSHALFHNRILMAKCYAKMKYFEKSYEISRAVLTHADSYDVTGDYRGFALNAHAVNAARLGKTDEVVDCLVDMARIYVDYNEPYMIKSAINGLADFIAHNDQRSYAHLRELGIIEDGFKRSDDTAFMVSSPVDLENPLTAGLESAVFGRRSASELRAYLDAPDRNLSAAFRSYGLWRQIAGRQAQSA